MPGRLSISFAAGAALVLLLLVPLPALACGGFFCSQVPIEQTGENIVFVDRGGTIETHVQISFQGEAEDFAWVVPVPGIPELELGTEELFRTLLWSTRPTFSMTVGDHTCADPYVYEGWDLADDIDADGEQPGGAGGGGGEVTILQQSQVGSYEATVVGATDAGALIDWFNCNGYRVAYSALPRVENYLEEGMDFLALKLTSGASVGDLMPLVMTYAGERPMIPLVLTAVATAPNLVVRSWFLSDRRAVPVNYDHVWLNDARIQWGNGWWYGGTGDYDRLAARAIDEAGGRAFVTDFSGDAGFLYGMIYPAQGYDLDSLRAIDDPAAFLPAALQMGLPRNGVMQGIIRRHIPMPAELVDQGVTEQQFYNGLANYAAWLDGMDFDPVAFVADIEELVVEPMQRADALFADPSRVRLTRMTSVISGWEMDEDPVFAWLPREVEPQKTGTFPWLGGVSQDRSAPGDFVGGDEETSCWQVALTVRTQAGPKPVISFPSLDGVDFPALEDLPSCLDLPAAMVVERFAFNAAPQIVLDNRAALAAIGGYCVMGVEPALETEPPTNVEWPLDPELVPAEDVDPKLCDQLDLDEPGFSEDLDPGPPRSGLFNGPGDCSCSAGPGGQGPGAALLLMLLVPGAGLARRRRGSRRARIVAAGGLTLAAGLLLGGCATPEAEAPRMAFAKVTAFEGVPAPEAVDAMLAAMDRLNLERAVLVPHGLSPAADTEAGLLLVSQHADRLTILASARPFAAGAPQALAQAGSEGAAGAKVNLSGGPTAGLEREELNAIAAACFDDGVPLMLEVDLRGATRQIELERLLSTWPQERFVLAHWGGLLRQLDRLDGLLIRHPNLWVDTSVGGDGARILAAAEADPAAMGALLQRHHERFVWGTGTVLADHAAVEAWEQRVEQELAMYRDTLGLTEQALARIFAGNANTLYGSLAR
jgi:predicted TIM-barrel fold metal-dependent hydrolase